MEFTDQIKQFINEALRKAFIDGVRAGRREINVPDHRLLKEWQNKEEKK